MSEWQSEDVEEILRHSYKDFHAKGLDYICLKRSDVETIKLYFFDGDASALPEVVAPHDHRYDFETTVLAGEFCNRLYWPQDDGEVYQLFSYLTPLNGGDGFTWRREMRLKETSELRYTVGQRCRMTSDRIHTIKILRPGTVLHLKQQQDVIPVDFADQMLHEGARAALTERPLQPLHGRPDNRAARPSGGSHPFRRPGVVARPSAQRPGRHPRRPAAMPR